MFRTKATGGAAFHIHDKAKVEVVKPRFETNGRGFTRGRGHGRGWGRSYGHGDKFDKDTGNTNFANGERRPQWNYI